MVIEQNQYPVAIRIPCNGVVSDDRKVEKDYSNINKFKIEKSGEKIAIIAVGDFYQLGESVVLEIEEKLGIQATLINPRYVTGLDNELLEDLKKKHNVIITLEDGSLDGGFGEKVASFYGDSNIKVKNYGIKKAFYDKYNVEELLKNNRLTSKQIVEDLKEML